VVIGMSVEDVMQFAYAFLYRSRGACAILQRKNAPLFARFFLTVTGSAGGVAAWATVNERT
ncbi:MAG: hypothetical protein P8Y91_06895, partial [Desulfuromonadales bacterium]